MTDICLAAARADLKYKNNILKTKDRLLIEAISSQYYWGSGLNHYQSKNVRPDKLPGLNNMGVILMNVINKLLQDENDDTDKIINPDCGEVTIDAHEANHELILNHSSLKRPPISPKPTNLGTPVLKRKASSTPKCDRKTEKNIKHNKSYIQEEEDTSDINDYDDNNKENGTNNT